MTIGIAYFLRFTLVITQNMFLFLSNAINILSGVLIFLSFIMPRLSRDVRNQVIGMLAAGLTINDVAGRLIVHRSTGGRLLSRYRRTGMVMDAQHPGRPRVTPPAQDRYIVNVHLRFFKNILFISNIF